jgi:hypothetical protein
MKVPFKVLFALLIASMALTGCLSFDGDDDDDVKVVTPAT